MNRIVANHAQRRDQGKAVGGSGFGEAVQRVDGPNLAAILLSFGFLGCFQGALAQESGRSTPIPEATIQELFQLRSAGIVALEFGLPESNPMQVTVELADGQFTLLLAPESVRGSSFELLAQIEGGAYVKLEAGPPRTLRGYLAEEPDTVVSAAVQDDGLHAMVLWPDGRRMWLEPLAGRVVEARSEQYVLYRDEDAESSGGQCLALEDTEGESEQAAGFGLTEPSGLRIATVACDADFAFFQQFADAQATVAHIEAIFAALNVQYERELGIRHVLSTIVVRTDENDPYDTKDPERLLRQFADQWNTEHAAIERDLAQLFTGEELDNTTVGIAWRYGVCNERSYGVVQPGCCRNLRCQTDLSAHELGHNWGAGHCDCPQWTMHGRLACANRFHPALSVPEITAYRDTRLCVPAADALVGLYVDGPTVVDELTVASYRAIARYASGTTVEVTPRALWQVEPTWAGTLENPGQLRAAEVAGDTQVSLSVTFRDPTGTQRQTLIATILEQAEPGPRTLHVTIVPSADFVGLRLGELFSADVFLSSLEGALADVRLLQFDVSATSGASIVDFTWTPQTPNSPLDSHAYAFESSDEVYRAVYPWGSALPGLILQVNSEPQRVARMNLRYLGPGEVNLIGPARPSGLSQGTRFLAGFSRIREFDSALGNVTGGVLPLPGTKSPALHRPGLSHPKRSVDGREP